MFDCKCNIEYPEENEKTHIDTKKKSHVSRIKKVKFKKIPTNFMCSDTIKEVLCEIIRQIELCREKQSEIDTIYDQLCNVITTDMKEVIPFYDASKNTRKRVKYTKPYWNQELLDLWKKLHKTEKHFRKVVRRTGRQEARIQVLATQRHFDKQPIFYERKYRRDLALNIETLNTENPSAL